MFNGLLYSFASIFLILAGFFTVLHNNPAKLTNGLQHLYDAISPRLAQFWAVFFAFSAILLALGGL